MLAVEDALQRIGVQTESVFASRVSSRVYRLAWGVLDHGLGVPYKLFPERYSRIKQGTSVQGMQLINTWMRRLDAGTFARYARGHGHHVVVASHVTASHLIRRPDIQVYLLGLDPYAGLYWNSADNVITTAVDSKTQRDMIALGTKQPRVTGPMVPLPVYDAGTILPKRLHELRAGKPLRVVIATGGSLTHGLEIAALTGAFTDLTTPDEVERISVVVGNSVPMLESVARHGRGDPRVSILYNPEPIRLVRMADRAIAEADIVIAKTGELAFCVAGGKAFKTFHTHPSLGPQEIAIKDYVMATSAARGLSALEPGLPPAAEVRRVLEQRANGTLFAMMAAGLDVPGDGALSVARMIQHGINSQKPGRPWPAENQCRKN